DTGNDGAARTWAAVHRSASFGGSCRLCAQRTDSAPAATRQEEQPAAASAGLAGDVGGEGGAGAQTELVPDPLDADAHRVRAEGELAGDVLVRGAAGDEVGDFSLPGGELRVGALQGGQLGAQPAQFADDGERHLRIDPGLAVVGRLDSRSERMHGRAL